MTDRPLLFTVAAMIFSRSLPLAKVRGLHWLSKNWPGILILLGTWLLVFGLRSLVIDQKTEVIPYWDEWYSIAELSRWQQGEGGSLAEMIQPHNEHRIFLQRAIWRGLTALNGEWNARLILLTNAAIAALIPAVLAAWAWWKLPAKAAGWVVAVSTLAFGLPIAWQNLLFAFQTSFYLQFLLSLLCFVAATKVDHFRWSWVLMVGSGVLACFTNGSGFFTAPVILGFAGLELIKRSSAWRSQLPRCVGALLILVLGLLLLHQPEATQRMRAQGPGEFVTSLLAHLAWPWQGRGWGLILWFPWLVLLIQWVRDRGPASSGSSRWTLFLLLFGGWIGLNLVGMAWARGSDGNGPQPRYEDFHLCGQWVQILAVITLLAAKQKLSQRAENRGAFAPRILQLALVGSSLMIVWGWAQHLQENLTARIPNRLALSGIQQDQVARHLAQRASFPVLPRLFVPTDSPRQLEAWLAQPAIVNLLGGEVRSWAKSTETETRSGVFDANQLPVGVAAPRFANAVASSWNPDGGKGEFVSPPFIPRTREVAFWYLGESTGKSLKLSLKPTGRKGKTVKFVVGGDHQTAHWQRVSARVQPGIQYQLVFQDDADRGWGAVTVPFEVGPLSSVTERILGHALLIALVGAGSVLTALLAPRER